MMGLLLRSRSWVVVALLPQTSGFCRPVVRAPRGFCRSVVRAPRGAALGATDEEVAWVLEGLEDWDDDDEDDEFFEATITERAWAEHAAYGGHGSPLEEDAARSAAERVRTEGVALVPGCLSSAACGALLDAVLAARDASVAAVAGGARPEDHLSSVLGATETGDATDPPVRFDVRLPLEGPVEDAARALLARGALSDAFHDLVGDDGELWELAALVSEPGAPPQAAHADTVWDDAPCLYTAFVALQAISAPMGPTRFFPGSHASADAQDALDVDSVAVLSDLAAASRVALLAPGQAALYDGRLVHCGGANSEATRALFYVTFRHPAADADDLGNADAHSIAPDLARRRLRLADFRDGAAAA